MWPENVFGPRGRPFTVAALADLVVDILDLCEEGVEVLGKRVLRRPESQMPGGAQDGMRRRIRQGRVKPVPRHGGIDDVESLRESAQRVGFLGAHGQRFTPGGARDGAGFPLSDVSLY
jgi:hypothetical protein